MGTVTPSGVRIRLSMRCGAAAGRWSLLSRSHSAADLLSENRGARPPQDLLPAEAGNFLGGGVEKGDDPARSTVKMPTSKVVQDELQAALLVVGWRFTSVGDGCIGPGG